MEKDILYVNVAVGYMLKVLKSNNVISKYNNEFKNIRHGNYGVFIDMVDGEIPYIREWNNGIISEPITKKTVKTKCDFTKLIASGPSLKIFLTKCKEEFGDIVDSDINDETYLNLAEFELAIRMHASNNNLIKHKDTFQNIINSLSNFINLPITDIDKLHKGRKFLNAVKHKKHNKKYDWNCGNNDFNEANLILKKHNISIL